MLAAADFFTVEVWGLRGLVTFYAFFVIELATRRIDIVGVERRSSNISARRIESSSNSSVARDFD